MRNDLIEFFTKQLWKLKPRMSILARIISQLAAELGLQSMSSDSLFKVFPHIQLLFISYKVGNILIIF